MTIRARAVIIAIACSVCACQAAGQDPPAGRAPDATASVAGPDELAAVDTPLYVNRAMIPPTPEMVKAALTGDPDAMRDAIANTASTCQASTTCPAQFASCTSWSTPTTCSSTCGASFCLCRPIKDCIGEPPEPKEVDTFNSFRICFDSAQNACTQWNSTTTSFCGC
ncbi:MAG TPA: hypothetical protein VHT91_00395 [Kofleriaceae bacterium]|jgi:hypothetical protein|nr:hypothetical protein [Kofleriaceae bacterium]